MQAQWVGAGIGESGFGIREGEDQGSAVHNPQSPIPNPGITHKSVSPGSLVVTAFAAVPDVRGKLTPLPSRDAATETGLLGLGEGRQRLGGLIVWLSSGLFGRTAPHRDTGKASC